jgi:hypothetical protein
MNKLLAAIFLILATSLTAGMAHAAKAGFQFSDLRTVSNPPAERVIIQSTKDGKIKISSGRCEEIVEGKVIVDNRPGDGDLELDLGRGRVLVVTSGFSITGIIEYYLKINGQSFELKPNVYFDIK